MKKFSQLLCLCALCCIFAGCKKLFDEPSLQYQYTAPEALSDGLETSSLEAEGLNKALIVQMTNQINLDAFKNIHSVVIVKNNKLVYEHYFNGYDREMLHNLYSDTKSVNSALVGIALDKGFIPDTNAKVLSYFPEYAPLKNDSPEKQSITIGHLLTMSSGLACNDWDASTPGAERNLYKEKNMLHYLWDLPLTHTPGTTPQYCSGGVITLVNILSKTCGQHYTEFAKTSLLDPLSITHYKWGYRENSPSDPDQIYMRPRDMAKFGMLYLNDGVWNNQQIVSKVWVDASFEPKVTLGNTPYGFLWWLHSGTLNGGKVAVYTASGNGGQFIYIVPSLNMVVAMTGGNLDSGYTAQGYSILYNYIFPATL